MPLIVHYSLTILCTIQNRLLKQVFESSVSCFSDQLKGPTGMAGFIHRSFNFRRFGKKCFSLIKGFALVFLRVNIFSIPTV
jgi:hypothetical protein